MIAGATKKYRQRRFRQHRRLMQTPVAATLEARDMRLDALCRAGGNHGADIGRKPVGIANTQFGERPLQHRQHAIRDIILQAEHAQRRTTLSRAIEGRSQHIRDNLLGERAGINDERILSARFGNERNWMAIGIEPAGQLPLDEPRNFGRTREQHAAGSCIGDALRAGLSPSPGSKYSTSSGHCPPRGASRTASAAIERRLFGRLGERWCCRPPARPRPGREDRHWEIPQRDTGDGPE